MPKKSQPLIRKGDRKQKFKQGLEIPVPDRDQFFRGLDKASRTKKRPAVEARGIPPRTALNTRAEGSTVRGEFPSGREPREDPIADLDMAWDLMNLRHFVDAVEVAEDGKVQGMDDAVDRLIDRYPFLVSGFSDSTEESEPKVGGKVGGRAPDASRPGSSPGVDCTAPTGEEHRLTPSSKRW
jgi:hypothetical protein